MALIILDFDGISGRYMDFAVEAEYKEPRPNEATHTMTPVE